MKKNNRQFVCATIVFLFLISFCLPLEKVCHEIVSLTIDWLQPDDTFQCQNIVRHSQIETKPESKTESKTQANTKLKSDLTNSQVPVANKTFKVDAVDVDSKESRHESN